MALVNDAKKEINTKIVYLGPNGAGKGTALRQIYAKLKPECRSEFKSMTLGDQQMVFFDFACPGPLRADSYSIRFHVYTILGGEGAATPWKMLLKGVDGVVFFADSTDGRMYSNLESCAVLIDSLAHYGKKFADIAFSLQCNKRDLRGALPLENMRLELFPEEESLPVAVIATTGAGLLEGLNGLVSRILVNLGQEGAAECFSQSSPVEILTGQIQECTAEPEEALDHCSADSPGFSVETAGEPVAIDRSTVVIPLRITGGVCGKSAEFKVTVSVGM